MQICCFTCSVILNVMATQYTCSLNNIYRPHWLVQWSHHCLCMCIPVLSPWLPGYIDGTQTILVILTMTGLITDRPCISISCEFNCSRHINMCIFCVFVFLPTFSKCLLPTQHWVLSWMSLFNPHNNAMKYRSCKLRFIDKENEVQRV